MSKPNPIPNSKPFKKGQSGNPNGRPKKSWTILNEQIKKEGYEPLSKSQLIESYRLLLSLPEDRLETIQKDKAQPYALRILVRELKDKKLAMRALQDFRQYAFEQEQKETIVYNVEVSKEEAKEILSQMEDNF